MTAHHTLRPCPDISARQAVTLIDRSGCPAPPHRGKPPRHGDERAYRLGCRCPDAREDHRLCCKRRREGRQPPAVVPNVGVRRRLEALGAIGWPGTDLAKRLGCDRRTIWKLREAPRTSTVTARKIAAIYDQLRYTAGPSTVTRKRATDRGWASPLAWDNIDDPNEHPKFGYQLGAQRPVRHARQRDMPVESLRAEVARLTAAGKTAAQIARDLNIAERTVVRARARFRETQASHEAA